MCESEHAKDSTENSGWRAKLKRKAHLIWEELRPRASLIREDLRMDKRTFRRILVVIGYVILALGALYLPGSTARGWLAYVAGYFFSVIVGQMFIAWIMRIFPKHSYGLGYDWEPSAIGLVESVLYTSALIIGGDAPKIILAWLVLKVAGRWPEGKAEIRQRIIDNMFLIGNGLSLLFAGTGGYIPGWALGRSCSVTIAAPIMLVFATWCFRMQLVFHGVKIAKIIQQLLQKPEEGSQEVADKLKTDKSEVEPIEKIVAMLSQGKNPKEIEKKLRVEKVKCIEKIVVEMLRKGEGPEKIKKQLRDKEVTDWDEKKIEAVKDVFIDVLRRIRATR